MPRVVARHGLDDADDIAAVLRYRVDKLTASPPGRCRLRPRLIAGLIPEPLGAMSAEDRRAIDERKELIESRARTLAANAVASREAWPVALAACRPCAMREPVGSTLRRPVATYRDRYKVTSDLPVGGGASSEAQVADRRSARAALRSNSAGQALRPLNSPSFEPTDSPTIETLSR